MVEVGASGRSDLTSVGGEGLWAATHPKGPEWKPWQVLDVDIAEGVPTISHVDEDGRSFLGVWVLVRAFDEPLGSVQITTESDISPEALVDSFSPELADAIRERLRGAGVPLGNLGIPLHGLTPPEVPEFLVQREEVLQSGPEVTAVVCTRDRPKELAICLQSLQEQSYPRTAILVVDNAPSTTETREVVEAMSGPLPVTYVVEPLPGLSNARNRVLVEAQTDIVAWIDDDETADPHWISEIVRGFSLTPEATFVCGLIIPGELDTPAQLWFEEYGGHSKGRGFIPAVFSPETASEQSPLFPLPAFGAGGNMAMRRSARQAVHRFNPALGPGTLSKGNEETKALTDVLLAGGTLRYQPTAVTNHFHRREFAAFERQLHGYGVGLSAYYTSLILEKPARLIPLARLLPSALRELTQADGQRLGGIGPHFPRAVLKAHRRGLFSGSLAYVRASLAVRRKSKPPATTPMAHERRIKSPETCVASSEAMTGPAVS